MKTKIIASPALSPDNHPLLVSWLVSAMQTIWTKHANFNIDWHAKESISARWLADPSRLWPILKGAGWLSIRFLRAAFFGGTYCRSVSGSFSLFRPVLTVSDGAFLPGPQSDASGAGSGKESMYKKRAVPGTPLLPFLQRFVSSVAMATEAAQAHWGPLGPTVKSGAGLEVAMLIGWAWDRGRFDERDGRDGLWLRKWGVEGEVLLD